MTGRSSSTWTTSNSREQGAWDGGGRGSTSLLELGEVCEREREKFNENNAEETTSLQPNTMKPPTPGCSSSSLVAPSSLGGPWVSRSLSLFAVDESTQNGPVVRELSATKETIAGRVLKDEILEEKTTAVFVLPKGQGKSLVRDGRG